eukprot:TRINITY_DN105160_c0_g1_i1.p1 TRINITY_DN105160_c0_g1~~TRINITY_DN105160_c0_g1_i1.p1  ORF type:complete len:315 (+),score=32.19 TRINITY_DN105160_c0_g1_i1:53-946(+)
MEKRNAKIEIDYEKEFLSDDEDVDYEKVESRHAVNVEILKYAREMIPETQLAKALVLPAEPALPVGVVSKGSTLPPATEYFVQLHVPSTYNCDLSSTKEGFAILQAMKTFPENLLPSIMGNYGLSYNVPINSSGETLAHVCAAYNRVDLLQFLDENGEKLDFTNQIGEQPVHYACREGSFEAATYIIEKLLSAVNAETNVILLPPKSKQDGTTPIFCAAVNSWHKVMEYLVDAGAYVNAQDKYGRTALHWVVFWNRVDTTKELIRLGASSSIADLEGNTPLDIAIMRGYKEIQDMLQ